MSAPESAPPTVPSDPPALAAHRPVPYYSECNCVHPDSLDESIPDDVAAEYESDYYDAHFSVADGDFESCNAGFSGWGCQTCADEQNTELVAWPCPFGDPDAPLPESRYSDPPKVPEAANAT